MRRIAFAAAVLAAAMVAAAHAASPPRDASATLSQVSELVERARTASGPERDALARRARDALRSEPELSDPAWLAEPLERTPPDLDRARVRLASASELLGRPQTTAPPPEARSILSRILARPPFRPWDLESMLPPWLLPIALTVIEVLELVFNLVRWPFDRLGELLERIFGTLFSGAAVVVLAALFTLGLVLLYRVGLRSAIVSQAEIAPAGVPLPPTAGEALAIAQRHAAAGRYRDACHYVFLSTLAWIEERGHARFHPASTNREYLTQLAAAPGLAVALRPVVASFDRLWYGQDLVTDVEYRDLLSLAARFREASA